MYSWVEGTPLRRRRTRPEEEPRPRPREGRVRGERRRRREERDGRLRGESGGDVRAGVLRALRLGGGEAVEGRCHGRVLAVPVRRREPGRGVGVRVCQRSVSEFWANNS